MFFNYYKYKDVYFKYFSLKRNNKKKIKNEITIINKNIKLIFN